MKVLTLFALLYSLTSCSWISSPTTGATDNPNFIRGTVIDANNNPVENAKIVIKNIRFTADTVEIVEMRTTKTDVEGHFEIGDLENERFTLFAEYEEKSHIIGRVELIGDSLEIGPVKITPSATIIGRVLGSETISVSVSVAGLSQTTQTNSQGEYILDNIPTGNFDIIFTNGDFFNVLHVKVPPIVFSDTVYIRDVELAEFGGVSYNFFESQDVTVSSIGAVRYPTDSLPDWYLGKDFSTAYYIEETGDSGITSKTDYLGRPVVLIDDFEFDTLIPNIDSRRGGEQFEVGYFFFYNPAQEDNPGSLFLPEGLIEDKDMALAREDAFRGQSFNVEILLSALDNFPFAGFGLRFDDYYDMSNLEEISFYARGDGTLTLSLWTRLVFEYPEGENWGHFGHSFELSQDWQLYRLPLENFVPRPSSVQEADSLLWSDAMGFVSGIEFIATSHGNDTVSVWLDEIKFVGTNFIRSSGE